MFKLIKKLDFVKENIYESSVFNKKIMSFKIPIFEFIKENKITKNLTARRFVIFHFFLIIFSLKFIVLVAVKWILKREISFPNLDVYFLSLYLNLNLYYIFRLSTNRSCCCWDNKFWYNCNYILIYGNNLRMNLKFSCSKFLEVIYFWNTSL